MISGGKDAAGNVITDKYWTSDNSFAYWALTAAQDWAIQMAKQPGHEGELAFAVECQTAAAKILNGINQYQLCQDST